MRVPVLARKLGRLRRDPLAPGQVVVSASSFASLSGDQVFGGYAPRPLQEEAMAGASEGDLDRMKERFSAIYDRNEWGAGSGVGSHPLNSLEYSGFLQRFIHLNAIKSVVDFGCGDWQFSRYVDWSGVNYCGFDIVPQVVDRNQSAYGQDNVRFRLFDSPENLPNSDLLICKDVFQHLSNESVFEYLAIFKSKFKYMLITNDIGPPGHLNKDIEAGGWRTLQFDHPPFSERAAIVLQWTVHSGVGWTSKATYLFYGDDQSWSTAP